jgi:hypothetical protein
MTKKQVKDQMIRDDEYTSQRVVVWEWKAPLVLLGIGLVGSLIVLFVKDGLLVALVGVVLHVVLSVPLTIGAMYLVARLIGVSFGFLNTAVLKLAAISLFSLALNLLFDWMGVWYVGWIVAGIASLFLFSKFFELDARETVLSVVLILVIRFVLGMFIGLIIGGLMVSHA